MNQKHGWKEAARTLVLGSILLPLTAFADAIPSPPPTVCLEGTCVSSNSAAASPSSATSPQTAVKWHPGNYAWYSPGADGNGVSGYRIDLPTQQSQLLSFIDSIQGEPTVKGVEVAVYWRALEGDTQGDYSAGFKAIDAILARCAKDGKRMMLSFQPTVFGNYVSLTDVFPAYVVNGANLGVTSFHAPQVGASARVWQAATMDRILALAKAYGARYDGNPNFEMWSGGETALAVTSGQDGFSNDNLLAQLLRYVAGSRAAFPTTAVRIVANDLAPDPLMVSLFATCAQYYCAVGGPDVWPLDITQADRVFVGLNSQGESVYTDYRDKLPWVAEAQWQSFAGQFTMAQLWNASVNGYTGVTGSSSGFALPSMHTKYFIWYVNTVNGNSSSQWSTAILPYIRSIGGAVYSPASCPSNYPACNTN